MDYATEEALNVLMEVMPPGRISTERTDRLAHAGDAWPRLAKWSEADLERVAPIAVVRPAGEMEVRDVLRVAARYRLGVVPFGAGSGVVGAVLSHGPSISLDMRSLAGILELDEQDCTLKVWAGTPAADVETFLNDRGYTWGHYPQSLPLATVGGLVATRSSGTFSSLYGSVEDRVLSLRVVLSSGDVIEMGASPRASTGPDLAQLFIGSEGALGVVTQATLKVVPLPQARRLQGIAFETVRDGLDAVRHMFRCGLRPAVIRLYDPHESTHLFEGAGRRGDGAVLLILGFDGPTRLVAAEEELALEVCTQRNGCDLGADIGEQWERNRFDASWLQRGNGEGRMADAIEISGCWSVLPTLYERIASGLAPQVDELWAHFSHFYPQGGSIYFIVFLSDTDQERLLRRYRDVWETAMRGTLDGGGSISHHHGIGEARLPWLAEELGGGYRVLAALKGALDPPGILNPGRFGLPHEGER